MVDRPQKITLPKARYRRAGHFVGCSYYRAARVSDIEPQFAFRACGKGGADVRPDFHWQGAQKKMMGFRWPLP